MKEKMTKIFQAVIFSGALVMLFGGVSALAGVDIGGMNGTTGPNSENENEWEIDQDIDLDIDNDSQVENGIEIEVETGENSIGLNTVVDGISTGDINGDIEVITDLNSDGWEIDVDDLWGDVEVDMINDTTGPFSENENEVEIDMSTDIDVDNVAEVDNDLDIYANTGNNSVRRNTEVGDVDTGDIDISGNIETTVNSNSSFSLPSMNSDVEADFSNDTTGPNSENHNSLEIDNSLDLDIDNSADIDNDLDLDLNTGNNSVRNNTVVGDVSTGSASFDFRIMNVAN